MLEPKQRGRIWYAYGRIEFNGRPISGYYRQSTGASSERGCRDWISAETERVIRCHVTGEADAPMSFAEAVTLYPATPEMAKDLDLLLDELGHKLCRDINGKMIRDLGPKLYPASSTDSWRRHVITPVRAVINNAHDLFASRCPPIKVKGYSTAERTAQDRARGKKSRIERTPGTWEWLLRFREHASPRLSAIAFYMFATGARVGQATAMNPGLHMDLQNARVAVPAAKGADDRWVTIPMELVVELANLRPRYPRGWKRRPENLRTFGYASRCGPLKAWHHTCDLAGIPHIMPHAAGRHAFGQEMRVRQGVDAKSVAAEGGWSDTQMLERTYTHAEDSSAKIQSAFRTGLAQAENSTGLKLASTGGKL